MNSKVFLMVQLQNQLNDATNGEGWKKGVTKNGKKIHWRRCIYMECAEMIDSFSWKHWKNIAQEPDWDNLKIEVVDVWHFILSLGLEDFYKNMRGGVEELSMMISELSSLQKMAQEVTYIHPKDEDVMQKVEEIMRISLSQEELQLNELLENFFELVVMSGMDLDALYRLYVGKNILNQFRQDNGYKEGTYTKVWDGKEDNVVMQRIWEQDPDLKPDILYKELVKVYHSLVKE